MVLDRAESRHRVVLVRRGTRSIPAVVGHVEENLRSVRRELPDQGRKDRFVADEDAHRNAEGASGRGLDPRGEVGHALHQTLDSRDLGKKRGKGQVFTEGHEVHLAVPHLDRARGSHEFRSDVAAGAAGGVSFTIVVSGKQVDTVARGEGRDLAQDFGIKVQLVADRGLRPHEQTRSPRDRIL